MRERIKPIPDMPGYYASNIGKVYSTWTWGGDDAKNDTGIFREKLQHKSGVGYPATIIFIDKKRYPIHIHRLVLLAFRGKPKKGHVCRHLDGDPFNNNLLNLRWGTHKQNSEDQMRHDTFVWGSRNGMAKLTEDDVREIKVRLKRGEFSNPIGRIYGVAGSAIRAIRCGKTWRHVTG